MLSNCEGIVFVKDIDIENFSFDLISQKSLNLEGELIFVKSNMYDFSNAFYINNQLKNN